MVPGDSTMKKALKFWTRRNIILFGLPVFFMVSEITTVYVYVDPAPPKRFVISTGEEDGNYYQFAKGYAEQVKKDGGIDLKILESEGALDNLERLGDPKSDVDVAFVQDGIGSRKANP